MKDKDEKTWEEGVDEIFDDKMDESTKEMIKLGLYEDLINDVRSFLPKLEKDLGKEKFDEFKKTLSSLHYEVVNIREDKMMNIDFSKIDFNDFKINELKENDSDEYDFLEKMKS